MKTILILFGVFSVGYAGVGTLTPEIEMEALRLWMAHCEGASEGGMDEGTYIYCKKSAEVIEEALKHEVALNPSEKPQDQVIFVQPPSIAYKHDVIVTGGGNSGAKTVIYVKPQKNQHEVNIVDQTVPAEGPQKPTLYFLKSHGGAEASPQAAAPAPAPEAETEVAAEGVAPAPEAPSGGYPDSESDANARKRRENNGPLRRVLALPTFEATSAPKRKAVYILKRSATY